MPSYLKNEVILVRYPFTNLSASKVRPAVAVHAPHPSQDLFVVPLTSQTSALLPGEFVLADWAGAGLHVSTAVKRGMYTVHSNLILKRLGKLMQLDRRGCP